MKKLLSLILALVTALCVLPASAATSGDWTYVIQDDGTAMIAGCTSTATSITIPDTLDGCPVTAIGSLAFTNAVNLTSLTIPDSVVSIEELAFGNCPKLTVFRVNAAHPVLATIDGVLFHKVDKALLVYPAGRTDRSYTVPQGIRAIGDSAFTQCDSLTAVSIPDSVTSIGNFAFQDCTALSSVTIGEGVVSIGQGSFLRCSSLSSVTIPGSVAAIGEGAFERCSSLTSVTIGEGVTSIRKGAFAYCTSLTSIAIPEGVSSISDYAFYSCPALTDVILPASLTVIGIDAFSYYSLTSALTVSAVFTVPADSYAHEWCEKNGHTYIFPESLDWLFN